MSVPRTLVALLVVLGLTACAADQRGPKEVGGALAGAAVGGLLGSRIGGGTGQMAATAAGTLLGAFAGSEVGRSLDRADRLHAERTARQSLERAPAGHTSRWVNPDTGHSGTFTPGARYESADGLVCRDYTHSVTIGGRADRASGHACREPDGTWSIVNR